MESLASATSSLKLVIISSTGQFPCRSNASFCMAESMGFTALKASCSFIINTPNVGNVILLLLVIEHMYCSFHFWASPAVMNDNTKAIFAVSVSYIVLLMFRYTSLLYKVLDLGSVAGKWCWLVDIVFFPWCQVCGSHFGRSSEWVCGC